MKYTDEELIEELKRVSEEHCDGETPRKSDIDKYAKCCGQTYNDRFGSWKEALDIVGFEKRSRKKEFTKEELIEELKRVCEEHCGGEKPSISDMDECGCYGSTTYKRYFGNWTDALEEIEYDERNIFNYSKEELIDELKRLSSEEMEDSTPTQEVMISHGKFSAAIYERRFDSWNAALEEAGFELNRVEEYTKDDLKKYLFEFYKKYCEDSPPTREYFNKNAPMNYSVYEKKFGSWNKALEKCGFGVNDRTDITKDELLSELNRLKAELGRVPRMKDMKEYGNYSVSPYFTIFGTWNEALDEGGMEKNHFEVSDGFILKEIERVGKEYCGGKSPTSEELKKYGRVSQIVATNRFGSWKKAISKTNLDLLQPEDYLPSGEEHPRWKGGIDTKNYGPSWYSSRKEVRQRDNFSCRVCGESEMEGAWIDVHHITPSRYWKEECHEEMNNPRNLICLCRSCHKTFEEEYKGRNHGDFEELARSELGMTDSVETRSLMDY